MARLAAGFVLLLATAAAASDWNDRMARLRMAYLEKFCDTRTNLLYGIPGTDADRDHGLPTPEIVHQQKPDYRGYGTAMSDTALFGGKVLSAFCDAYDATGDERIAPDARRLFNGLAFMMTVAREKGFVPRGPHPADVHAYYKDSSGDQHWMWVFGMWRYFHSRLATDEDRKLIAQRMSEVIQRFERNGWRNLNEDNAAPAWADGGPLRQPAFGLNFLSLLAAAHSTTGDERWGQMYRDACDEKDGERLKFLKERQDLAPSNIYGPEQNGNKLFLLSAYDKVPARLEVFNGLRKKQALLNLEAEFPTFLVGDHRPVYVDGEVEACGDKLEVKGAFEWRKKLDLDLMYRRGRWSTCNAMFTLHHIRAVVRWPLIAFNVAMRSGAPELARKAGLEARAILEQVDWDCRYLKWETQSRAIIAGSLLQAVG